MAVLRPVTRERVARIFSLCTTARRASRASERVYDVAHKVAIRGQHHKDVALMRRGRQLHALSDALHLHGSAIAARALGNTIEAAESERMAAREIERATWGAK